MSERVCPDDGSVLVHLGTRAFRPQGPHILHFFCPRCSVAFLTGLGDALASYSWRAPATDAPPGSDGHLDRRPVRPPDRFTSSERAFHEGHLLTGIRMFVARRSREAPTAGFPCPSDGTRALTLGPLGADAVLSWCRSCKRGWVHRFDEHYGWELVTTITWDAAASRYAPVGGVHAGASRRPVNERFLVEATRSLPPPP